MSGDVQPRKRKDKRRKKDDDDAGTPPPTLINPSSEHSTDNVTIHVHKEGGTGGHWCARIIFFALLTVLVGLVGIIIFENRGITDVDTPVASSRWAVIFDGWVDDILPQHDDEPHEEENASEETDEHEEEETEEEEEKEDDDEHGDHDEEEEEEQTEEDVEEKDSPEVDDEEDEGIGSDEEQDEDEEEEEADGSEADDNDEGEDDQQESVEEDNISRQHAYEESREAPDADREDDAGDDKFDNKSDEGYDEQDDFEDDNEDYGTLEEVDNASEEEEQDVDDDDDDDGVPDEDGEEDEEANDLSGNDLDVSIEGVTASKEREDDDASQEFFSIPGVVEIDDNSAEPLEEIEDGELEEVVNELEIEPDEEEIEEESSSVAVKFGVGVALIVAAHFVLVRRWNNVEAELAGSYSDEVLDLSRRNTIVPPTNPKDSDIATANSEQTVPEEKIVQSYEELRVKYRGLEVDSPDITSVKKTLGKIESLQMRNTSLPEKGATEGKKVAQQKEEEVEDMQTSESERLSATEPEEEDDEEDEEEVSEEEEEEEEEEDEEAEDVDDSELVAKLEAKYGKLPTPTESEEEEDEEEDYDEEEDDEEEAEEEDEAIQGWKRVKAPKGGHSESASEQRNEARGKEAIAPKGRQGPSGSAGGKSVHEHVNDTSTDEVSIQEEINSWLSKELDN